MSSEKTAFSKNGLIIAILILFFIGTFYFLTGFVVVQPIGAIPDGITFWYFRAGLNLSFITSPDGLSLKATGQLSLLGRMLAMSTIIDVIKDRIILRLPYSNALYLISTGGREFEN